MIEVKDLSFSYKQKNKQRIRTLNNISFTVADNTTCAIIGPSGCGKTTLLYLLAGLLRPEKGNITINGNFPEKNRESIAVILQEYGLLPWKSVKGNVAMGLKLRGVKKKAYQEIVEDILAELNIDQLSNKYPVQLSGGQRQRVAIARALALKPDLILMDEPFSALDALTRESMQKLFLDIWQKYLMTAVFVTHSIEEAVYLGNKIIIMSDKSGRITAEIDNQHFAKKGWRNSDSFYNQCERIRFLLEEGMLE